MSFTDSKHSFSWIFVHKKFDHLWRKILQEYKVMFWTKMIKLLSFGEQKHKVLKHLAFTGHNTVPHKLESETNYSHLGWSRLLRWDILWIGFTFAESWWEDKVTECTSSHLKYRHESRTGVSWVYPSCQSINDNYWARTPVGGERRNEIDHGERKTGNGTNYGDWNIMTKTEWYYQPTQGDRLLPNVQKVRQFRHHDRVLDFALLIKRPKRKILGNLLQFL